MEGNPAGGVRKGLARCALAAPLGRYLVATMLVAALGCGPPAEDSESHYRDMAAAEDDGAPGRGWIPRFIPLSARDITERHNRDTNEIWMAFAKEPEDVGGIATRCEEIETAAVLWPGRVPDWWPSTLANDASSRDSSLSMLRCSVPHKMAGVRFRRVGYMAVDSAGERVWYWELAR